MKRPRSTPEYHAGASAFSGTPAPFWQFCTKCGRRCGAQPFDAEGLPFCRSACRSEWLAIERDRVGVPL